MNVLTYTLFVLVISFGFSHESYSQRTSKPKKTPKVQGKSPASASGNAKYKRRTVRPRNSAPKGFKERKVAPRNSAPKGADRTRVQTRKPSNGGKFKFKEANQPRSINSNPRVRRSDIKKHTKLPSNSSAVFTGFLKRKKSSRNSNNIAAKGPFNTPSTRKRRGVIKVNPRSTGLNSSRRISRRDAARMKSFPTVAGIYSGNIKRKKTRGSNIKGPFRVPSGNKKYEVIKVTPRSIKSNASLKISRRDGILARSLPSIASIHGGSIKIKKSSRNRRYMGTSSSGKIKWSKGKDYPDTRTIGLVKKGKDVTKKTTRVQANFIGHTKLKFKKKKGMHPSYVFKMGSLKTTHDKKEAARKRWRWIHNKQKNIDQPKAVKEKPKKPRYDSKERNIWVTDRSKASSEKKKGKKGEKVKQGEQEEEKQD